MTPNSYFTAQAVEMHTYLGWIPVTFVSSIHTPLFFAAVVPALIALRKRFFPSDLVVMPFIGLPFLQRRRILARKRKPGVA
jgi:hypothetical protein